MRHCVLLTAIVAAMAFTSGCQTPDETAGRLLIDPMTARELDYNVDWQINLAVPAGRELIYAELLGDRLITLEDANIVSAVDARSGRILWRHQVTRPQEQLSRPQRDGDRLVVGSQRRSYVLDINSGETINLVTHRHVAMGTPVLIDGIMIHASPGGVLFAHELDTGLEAWRFQIDVGFASAPTLARGRLFATDLANNVWCFDPVQGRHLWDRPVGEPVEARPVAGDRLVYVPSRDQSLYALLLTNGRVQWRHYTGSPLTRSPFLLDDLLLQEVPGEGLVSLDPDDGEALWERQELIGATPLQIRDGTLDLFRGGRLLHVDTRDGEIADTTDLPGVEHIIAADPRGGDLFLIRLDGRILRASLH